MSRLSSISNALATWVGVIAAVAGGYIGLDGYIEDTRKRVDERQQAAFQQVQIFLSRDLVPIRDKARAFVAARWQCGSEPYQSFGLTESELQTYVELFDMVDACSAADLCDHATIERFFAPHARSGWPVLREYIGAVRAANKALKLEAPFGAGLEHLAGAAPEVLKCGS